MSVCLTIYKILCNYVISSVAEALVRDGLNLKGKVEIAQIFEGDRRHTDLIFLGWDFDDWSILICFIQILDTKYLRDLALSIDREGYRDEALKLNL